MNKFFVISDVHSFLTPLKEALKDAGFDPNNPDHYLVSCGDLFDRGDESEELLHYIMSLNRKILIKGNHDILLEDCCQRTYPNHYDFNNGTVKTINDIGGASEGCPFYTCCHNAWNKMAAYRDSLVNYFETKNYIFVHSWIARKCSWDYPIKDRPFEYDPNWRNANRDAWEHAMWGNPFELAEQGFNKTSKTLIFGHWHCSAGWAKKEGRSEFGEDAKWDIYKNEEQKIIGLDKCTVYTKKVNVLVIEDEFINKI